MIPATGRKDQVKRLIFVPISAVFIAAVNTLLFWVSDWLLLVNVFSDWLLSLASRTFLRLFVLGFPSSELQFVFH